MTLITSPQFDAKAAVNRIWWLTALRGAFSIALGLTAMFWPQITVSALFMIFGIFTIIDGVIALGIGLFGGRSAWGWSVFQGITGIVIGVLVLRYPQTVAALIVIIFAIWALVIGLIQVVLALRLRTADGGNWAWVLISGLIITGLGLYFLINPDTGAAVLAMVIGIVAVLGGVVLVFGAVQLRRHRDELVTLLES